MNQRTCLILAAILGGIGITLGAFGAHSLPGILQRMNVPQDEMPARAEWFETGVRYHMYHSLALLALAMANLGQWPASFRIASLCWLIGVLIFSGCLYAMALSGVRVLGAVVPLGGVSLIVGWVVVVVGAAKQSAPPKP